MGDYKVETIEQAANLVPAILTTERAPHLTERYAVAHTGEIVRTLEATGWQLAAVSGCRPRDLTRPAVGLHGVRLTHRDACLTETGEVPQLVLRNAHDGSSALTLKFGFYRFACANATVVGSTIGSLRILHRDYTQARLLECISELMAQAPRALAQLETWRSIRMTESAEIGYLSSAQQFRWAQPDVVGVAGFAPIRRVEDRDPTLYHVFQRAQEGLIKGGCHVTRRVVDVETGEVSGKTRRARPVGALLESSRINTGLWDLTAQWATEHA